jgi:hypothetical protein
MARRKNRKLAVGDNQFLRHVSHRCHEVLRFRKMGSNGHVVVLYEGIPEEGYRVRDGLLDSGFVWHADGRELFDGVAARRVGRVRRTERPPTSGERPSGSGSDQSPYGFCIETCTWS